jgi:6-phosphogluconolactonase
MNQPEIKKYSDPDATARAFAKDLVEKINEGNTHIALSGGSTPNILFDILAKEYSFNVKWQNAHLYWGDERCVPPFHAESNFLFAKTKLIDHVAIPTENVHRIRGENEPGQESYRYSQRVKTLVPEKNGWPRFDIVILGLGTDGHTASIFPNQMDLLTSENICDVAEHPESGQKRITLTGKVINNAAKIAFLVTGTSKAEKVATMLSDNKSRLNYPAGHILPTNGKLTWYLDEPAGALIS